MKGRKITSTILIIIIGIAVAAGYVAGFFVYMEYKQKIAYFDRKTQLAISKFEGLEGELKEAYTTLLNTMGKNKTERELLLSKIRVIQEEVQDWKKHYSLSVSALEGKIEGLKVDRLKLTVENLEDDIHRFKTAIQDLDFKIDESKRLRADLQIKKDNTEEVDLGRILVKNQKKQKKK